MSKFSIGSLLEPLGDIVSGAAKTIVPTIGSVVSGIGSSVTSKSGGSLLDGIISSGKSILSSVTSGGGLFKNIGSSISNLFKGNGTSQKGLISGLVSNISKGISSAVSSIGNLFNGNKSGSTSGLLGGGLLSGIGSLFSGLKDKIGGVQNTVLNSSGQTKVDTNELGRLKDALSSFTNKIGSSFDSYKSNFDNLGMSGSGLEGIFSNAKSKIDELIQNKDIFSTTMNNKLNGIIEKVFNIDKSANNTDGNNNAIGNLSEKIPKLNLGEKLSFDKLNFSGKDKGNDGNVVYNKPSDSNKQTFKDMSFSRYYNGAWHSESLTDNQADCANDMYNTLKNEGLNDAQIAGIMGNAFTESAFDNNNTTLDSNGYYAHGCFQNNESGRYKDFVKYCNNNGYSANSTEAQTKYVVSVMKKDPSFMNASDSATGAQVAADRVRSVYEVSGSADTRKTNAANIYKNIS